MTEKYTVYIGEQNTPELTFRDAAEYIFKLANLSFVNIELRRTDDGRHNPKDRFG